MSTHRIEHASAEDFLRTLTDASVDAIITDPPYGTNDGAGKRTARGGDTAAAFALEWDRVLPLDWLRDAARALRAGGACTVWTDCKRVGDVWAAGDAAGLKPRHTFYWAKVNPPPTPRPNFASAVEAGVYFVKPGAVPTWNGGGWCRNVVESVLAHNEHDGRTRHHPTQKPIKVMRWLVEIVTNEGDLVVDPFMGSGTTGVACVQTGRRFAGCDIDEAHVETARARVASWLALGVEAAPVGAPRAFTPQLDLFGAAS